MNRFAIAGLTVGAVTVAATIVLLFVSPWLSLLALLAGAVICREIAAMEDEAIAAELDAIEYRIRG